MASLRDSMVFRLNDEAAGIDLLDIFTRTVRLFGDKRADPVFDPGLRVFQCCVGVGEVLQDLREDPLASNL
ncbi:hypothetical protein D9M68_938560 [compost metagenome]